MAAASRSGSTSAVMRLSSPSFSTFSSQASRSLALAPRAAFRASAFAGCGSAAAPTLTLMSMSVSRSFAGQPKSSALYDRGNTAGPRALERSRAKTKARRKGRAKLDRGATERLEARHHALETEQVGERFKFPPLVVAKAHDQGEPRRFEPFDIHLAHVDRGRAAAVLRFPRVLHL